MAISKRSSGAYGVWIYDPRRPPGKRKIYVGQRPKKRGPGGAEQLERDEQTRVHREIAAGVVPEEMTVAAYVDYWLAEKHGPGTRRPAPATLVDHRGHLRHFTARFGDRTLKSLGRREALRYAGRHPAIAVVVSAMLSDAVDEQVIDANVYAKRGQAKGRGRKDVIPLTEQEIDELAQIARDTWGAGRGYGEVVAAWILFLAWVGCRPAEAFACTWPSVDFDRGLVTITRCKPPHSTDTVILPPRAAAALETHRDLLVDAGDDLLFHTVRGKPLAKSAWTYYWGPVRAVFMSRLAGRDPARLAAVVGDRDNFDLYELRHFCASWLVENGSDEYDGSFQLGNSPEVFRETYMHRYEDNARDRLRKTFDRSRVAPVVELRNVSRGGA